MLVAIVSLLGAACAGSAESTTTASGDSGDDGSFDAEAYFEGKTIRIVIMHSVGGGTDVTTRYLATHLPGFLPGNPGVAPTNLNFTGGTNLVYEASEDEILIGATSKAQNLYAGVADEQAAYEPLELQLLGGLAPDSRAIILHGNLGVDDFGDVAGQQDPPLRIAGEVAGAEEIVDERFLFPWLCETFEANCEFIQVDDDGSATLNLMMEREEINVTAGGLVSRVNSLGEALTAGRFVLGAVFDVQEGGIDVELPEGVDAPPELKDVIPADSMDEWEVLQPIVGNGGLSTTFYMGPNVPEEVVNVLREGFLALMADEEFLEAFGEQLNTTINFIPGPEAEEILIESTAIYEENLAFYNELQTRYWDDYWSG
jgi:tripartite-type tricarboxylate transporter receptor subunit TctC